MNIATLWVSAALALLGAGEDKKPLSCQDTSAIKWMLPGEFAKVRERATESNRIIVIKGIAFGVDSAGAKCATKGQW